MQDAYNTREGEVGKKNYKEEELIDWVHVQHDDSAKVVEATHASDLAWRVLRAHLKFHHSLAPTPATLDLCADAPAVRRGLATLPPRLVAADALPTRRGCLPARARERRDAADQLGAGAAEAAGDGGPENLAVDRIGASARQARVGSRLKTSHAGTRPSLLRASRNTR